jgi:hypothetical protein
MNDPFRNEAPPQRVVKPGECPVCDGSLSNHGDVGPTWQACMSCGHEIGRDTLVFEGAIIGEIADWLTKEGQTSSAAKLRDGSWRSTPTQATDVETCFVCHKPGDPTVTWLYVPERKGFRHFGCSDEGEST